MTELRGSGKKQRLVDSFNEISSIWKQNLVKIKFSTTETLKAYVFTLPRILENENTLVPGTLSP